ncbi:MAG: hypothetical protein RLZZ383_376, partial [Pseudomonadota bacterium]
MDDIDAAAADWAVQDVRARLELGSERARGLWQPEEEAHVAAWLALQGEPARAAARATTWVGPEWSASRWPPSVVADLLHAGIVVSVHDPATRRRLARREALVAAAHRAGCAVDGRVEDLRARLAAADADVDGEVLAFARPRLLRDVMRWATLRPWPDPAMEVLERLERVRWPTYVAEGGPVVPARALWDAWADRMDDPGSGSLEATLSLLATPWRPPGRLDVAAAVVRAWTERLTVGPVVDGRSLRALAEVAGREGAAAWLGAAQAFAQASAWAEASDVVRSARLCLRPIDQPALARFTRRWVPRGLPRAPPMPPLRAAPRRDLALPASGDAGRRRWQGLAGASVIERAVVEHLAAHGREAVAGEGALWRSIVGLLL